MDLHGLEGVFQELFNMITSSCIDMAFWIEAVWNYEVVYI